MSPKNEKTSISQDNIKTEKADNSNFLTNPEEKKKFILKSHRHSPIFKTTSRDRSIENMRLSLRVNKPIPTINTKKLVQEH